MIQAVSCLISDSVVSGTRIDGIRQIAYNMMRSPSSPWLFLQQSASFAEMARRLLPHRAMVEYPSGQRGQTVNLLAHAFEGSNPSSTTIAYDIPRVRLQMQVPNGSKGKTSS